ncbi:MAG: protein-glutamate O-methyltransferase CheR [Rickettsiales bacterium]
MATSLEQGFAFGDKDFSDIAALIKKETGIHLEQRKRNMVYARLASRIRANNFTNFRDYLNFIEANGEEFGNFINAMTTNVTHFFREGHHFDYLYAFLCEELRKRKSASPILLWSTASSSGQEPYSMACVAARAQETAKGGASVRILATDLDSNMIAQGEGGTYPGEMLEKFPPEYKKYAKYDKSDGVMRIAPEVKRMVAFRQLNLMHAWPMKRLYAVVFCRNVVIYFDQQTQETLYQKIDAVMEKSGMLCIGHSENLHGPAAKNYTREGRTMYRKCGQGERNA